MPVVFREPAHTLSVTSDEYCTDSQEFPRERRTKKGRYQTVARYRPAGFLSRVLSFRCCESISKDQIDHEAIFDDVFKTTQRKLVRDPDLSVIVGLQLHTDTLSHQVAPINIH